MAKKSLAVLCIVCIVGALSLMTVLLKTGTSISEASTVSGCYNPVDYGAIPVTIGASPFDSRPAFMAALDAIPPEGGTLCIPAGRFFLSRAPAGSYNPRAGISLHRCHVTIKGEGEHMTTLEMSGDQGASTTFVISLDPGTCDVHLRDFTIDTTGMFNTDEQTHAIAIGTAVCTPTNGTCSLPTADVSVEHLRFIHPPASVVGQRKGDCIRILGNTTSTPVLRTRILGNSFDDCGRSSISVQRNVNSLTVIGNHFSAPRVDQQFDGEASGGEWDEGLALIGNTFDDNLETSQGDYAIALTSQHKAVISGNILNGRGISLYRTSDIVVADNVINATFKGPAGLIESGNLAERLVIHGNIVNRKGVAGPAIRVAPHSSGVPTNVTIENNIIQNETDGPGIFTQSAQDITISDNSITFPTPTANAVGITFLAQSRIGDGVVVNGNRIVGALYAGVRLQASPFGFNGVNLIGNQVRGSNQGLRCEGTGVSQPIVSTGNKWGTVACSIPFTAGS